jgi:hypothetical protein
MMMDGCDDIEEIAGKVFFRARAAHGNSGNSHLAVVYKQT